MPIIESPGYNEPEYNENGENEYNENGENEYNDGNNEYNDGNNEYNENESGEYNDGENEYNDSDALNNDSLNNDALAATSSLVVITAASRPRGIGAWLAHLERERRGSSILARLRSLVF
jgi:hypothetical protein